MRKQKTAKTTAQSVFSFNCHSLRSGQEFFDARDIFSLHIQLVNMLMSYHQNRWCGRHPYTDTIFWQIPDFRDRDTIQCFRNHVNVMVEIESAISTDPWLGSSPEQFDMIKLAMVFGEKSIVYPPSDTTSSGRRCLSHLLTMNGVSTRTSHLNDWPDRRRSGSTQLR